MNREDKILYLRQYKELMDEVEKEAARAGFWKEKASCLSTPNLDNLGIKGGTGKRMEDYVTHFLELAEECAKMGEKAEIKRKEILEVIDEIPVSAYRRLLKLHYIDAMNFMDVAKKMGYSLSWVRKAHRKAINMVRLPENGKCDTK